jgi:ZIP family zinc transporter
MIGEAALWGLAAGSSLVIGAAIAFVLRPGHRAVGLMMAFGSGALISAIAYELVGDAFEAASGSGWVGAGLAVGALAFFAGSWEIERRGGGERKSSRAAHEASQHRAIVLGTVLDGIPEGIVLGIGLIGGGGGSVAVIGAVFMSNLPEAVAASGGLARGGMSRRRIYGMWIAIMLLTSLAAIVGYGLFDTASAELIAFTQAFAGGALLVMLADTMMPEAFKEGGRAAGLLTTLGFAVAFVLAQLG